MPSVLYNRGYYFLWRVLRSSIAHETFSSLMRYMGASLQLDEATMVVVRIVTGIRKHWIIRASEWMMLYPAIGIGVVLTYQENLFQIGKSFTYLARWMDQPTWALFILVAVLIRLVALIVNGTFKAFPYSPHMRLAACIVGIIFWSQYCLGFVNAAYSNGGAWTAPVAYSTFVLLELLNIYRVWGDIARGQDE